jgi:DNA-binding NarL/FixJ family response regulator
MKSLRILIADDDNHARAGLRAFLSAIVPCEIVGEAANGVELLVQAARYHPHVVVLDLRMPEIDGIQATRMLKAGWPDIAVVALTLYREQREAALAAGADAFVTKGDAPIQLVQALQTIQLRFSCDAQLLPPAA